jgi:osmotically-inducible protein OsmY
MQLADVELSQRVKVVTVDKTVYLLGRVNAQTAARATRLARDTRRVFRVEPLFEHGQ